MGGSRRDFRLAVADPNNPDGFRPQPVIWKADAVKKKSDTEYTVYQGNPVVGWKAFFIEMTFKGPDDSEFEFTTETQIIPDTFAVPDCHGIECRGTLV
ncbi:autocrine proliferation repressor protein A-like [Gigantopelta aegis]|nr:autocrine proliferation repressor protein A-like [Gigantopelta aegis]